MQALPSYVYLLFLLSVVFAVYQFWRASNRNTTAIWIIAAWLAFQSLPAISLFYAEFDAMPPRFLLLIAPPVFGILMLLFTKKGRLFLTKLKTEHLMLLNLVRFPVEIVLYWLFLNKSVPQEMTFEGSNPDIISAITAPIILLLFRKTKSQALLLIWNVLAFVLLLNIVSIAIMSAPTPFQQMAFQQPNIAVAYFPFVWLPACIVPLVLLGHVAMIKQSISSIPAIFHRRKASPIPPIKENVDVTFH